LGIHATGLAQPVAIVPMPGDASHIYVVQRAGRVSSVDTATGFVDPAAWLDVTSLVRVYGDGGLLGLAFAHDFQNSGLFYVYFTRAPDSYGVIMQFHADPSTHVVDGGSGHVILAYPRNPGGHNGGWIGVSPVDHYLYLSSGDGGTAADPDPINASQTITGGQFQGKMLRIDPTGDDFPLDSSRNYRIPPTNPFVGTIADPEIWAYGLRNAWRCSFDRATGDLWMGDVGQDAFEEINVEPSGSSGGRNYGWRCVEGPQCTGYSGCTCPLAGSVPPYLAYDHTVGQSITGGVVYRGQAIPGLVGQYVCADWSAFKLFVVAPGAAPVLEDVTAAVEPGGTPLLSYIAAIGEDSAGEIYLADWLHGRVLKLLPGNSGACCLPADGCDIRSQAMCESIGGYFAGRGTTCDVAPCQRLTGACCTPSGCVVTSQALCQSTSGAYWTGLFTTCEDRDLDGIADICAAQPGCLADFNQDGGVDGADVEAFFLAWEAGVTEADVNFDGGVDGADIESFFLRWEAGC
jgi:glucose/arabinose dehydrogenase